MTALVISMPDSSLQLQESTQWDELISRQLLDALQSLVQYLSNLQLKDAADDGLFSQLLQVHEQAMAGAVAGPSSNVQILNAVFTQSRPFFPCISTE